MTSLRALREKPLRPLRGIILFLEKNAKIKTRKERKKRSQKLATMNP